MKKYLGGLIGLPVAALLVWLDQFTKVWAETEIQGKGTIQILGDFFIFQFAKNRGAFLSLGNNLPEIFWWLGMVILPIAALGLFTFYIIRRKTANGQLWALWTLVMAGGVGNLIDRISVGMVTDFMNLGIGPVRTGIFNVADLYVVFAVVLLVLGNPFKKEKSS